MAFYLGRRGPDDLVLFRSSTIPTKESHGHLYTAVIGPFKSKVGASYFARYGRNNPHIHTADDAERLARADPRMEQVIVEESMTDEELAIALECDAQDQAEYSPQLNLPVQSRQEFFQTQGAISCQIGLKTN
ncbi:MAG: hypothetical protein HUU11_18575 [Anaerolineales bacterium]|nr:hypothetical protein [Anaerolineales bacterium]